MEIQTNQPIKQAIPFQISVVITQKTQQPCIELRRVTKDLDLIKEIISAAFHERPLIFIPKFQDKIKSIGSLIDKGIIYYDEEKQQYFYTI